MLQLFLEGSVPSYKYENVHQWGTIRGTVALTVGYTKCMPMLQEVPKKELVFGNLPYFKLSQSLL